MFLESGRQHSYSSPVINNIIENLQYFLNQLLTMRVHTWTQRFLPKLEQFGIFCMRDFYFLCARLTCLKWTGLCIKVMSQLLRLKLLINNN